jgi:YhcH/YjgK/YiaL family protein
MIADRLANGHRYAALGPRIARAFEFLNHTDLNAIADGRHEIDGSNLYATVQRYSTKLPADGKWEAHRVYADLQFIVSGEERFGIGQVERFTRGAYDAEKDFEALAGDGDFLRVQAGRFVLLWPGEPHMPGMALDAPAPVKKVVVKIKID